MTYTTVHKDYEAETFEAAAMAMLLDTDIWKVAIEKNDRPGSWPASGEHTHYLVESWEWDGKRLRVHFR